MRRSAPWQCQLDERILEAARDEGLVSPEVLLSRSTVQELGATRNIILWRFRMLADVDLVDFELGDTVELTEQGRQYLEGQARVDLYPWPRRSRALGCGWDHEDAFGGQKATTA